MVGVLQSIWRLMTGEVIRSTEIKIHNGQTKVTLALRRTKSGALFVSLKQRSAGNTQWMAFEPGEFHQFTRATEQICEALVAECGKFQTETVQF